jgi:dephospho-CoA kinase
MIIGICGRKHSGKSSLSNILIDKGYVKISFAGYLKELCSSLYDFPIEWTYDQIEKEKEREHNFRVWDSDSNNKLSLLINEKITVYRQ